MGLFKKRKKPKCLFVDMNDENLKSQGFMADKKGAVAVIFAVTLVPIVGLTGAAIDYSRAQQSRAVLQAAADAAALAGSRALMETASETNITTVQTAVRDRIDRFVQANIEGRTYSSTALNGVYLDNWEIKNNRRSLYVRLGSNVPMLFGSFLGASTRTVMAEAEVTYGQGRAEIAIAVGSSYSMLNHMTALRQAVDDFVDIVFDGQASQAETLVSIIPFTAAVNIGNDTTIHTGSPNLAAMMDVNGLAPRHGVTFENKLILGGCYVPPPPPPPPPTCPPGFVWDEWMYSCVCSDPSFVINYNPTPETCIPDPCTAPAVWDGYSCSPPPPPPPPPATCSPTCGSNMNCVSPNTCSCINHYVPNPSGPGCIPGPCPPPASGTWGNCTCPPGMSWTGSTCSPPPPPPTPCPPPATGTLPYCDCPSPDYWDGYQCSPPPPPPPPPPCTPCVGTYPNCVPQTCPPGYSIQGECPDTTCVQNPGGGSGCGPNNPCPPGALLDVDDLIHTAQSPAWGTVVSQIGGHLSQWLQNFGFSPAIAQSGSPLNAGATSWPYGTFPYNAGMLGYYGLIMDPASNANVVQLVAPTSRFDPGVCGYRLPSQVNYFDLFRSIGVTWGGCVEARPYPHNVQDTVPTSGTPATLFVPYFAPDEPEQVHKSPFTVNDSGAYWEQGMYFARYAYTLSNPTSNPPGGSYVLSTRYVDKTWDYTDSSYPNLAMTNNYIRAYQRYINTNYDDDYYWNTSTYAFSNERMKFTPTNMQYFIWKYNFSGYSGSSMLNQQTYSGRSFTTGPNAGCPVSILPASGVKADITAKMNAMKAEYNSGTNVVEGLAWAWRSISPNLPFAGRAYGTDNPKFLILMTDGQNDLATLRNNLMRSTYTAHGYANDFVANGTWTSEPSTTVTTPVQGFNWNNEKTPLNTAFRSTLDANFTELCTNIKTTNTKIFIILYSPTGEMAEPRTPATTAMFQSCSSGNGYFYEAFSQDDLIAAFQGIGGQIRQLRIVR